MTNQKIRECIIDVLIGRVEQFTDEDHRQWIVLCNPLPHEDLDAAMRHFRARFADLPQEAV